MIGPPIDVGPGASAQASPCIKAALPAGLTTLSPSWTSAVLTSLCTSLWASRVFMMVSSA